MPISKWICQACGGREVPLDHFATTKCGDTVHPDFAFAVRAQEEAQGDRTGVRVTHGLGCPRRAAIQAKEDFAIDPLASNASLTGTAWHALMEKHGPADQVEVKVSGKVRDIPVTGKIDRLRKPYIEDWKHIGDFSLKYRKEDGIKLEHRVQASVYSWLCEESGQYGFTHCRIWYHTSKGGKDALTPVEAVTMPIHDALEVKPFDGLYTVYELYQQADKVFNNGGDWRELPLAGESQTFGAKRMCDFCEVRDICSTADKGAPF